MTIDDGDRSEKVRKRYLSKGRLFRSRVVVISIVLMMLTSFLWMLSKHESTEKDDDINVDVDENSQRYYHFEKLNQLATYIALHTQSQELLVVSYTQQGKKERGATGTPGWGNAVLNFAAVNGMALSLHRPAYLAHAAISALFHHPTINVTWPMMTDELRKQIQSNMREKRKQTTFGGDHMKMKNKGGQVQPKSNNRRLTEHIWTCKMNFKRYHFDTFADALSIGCNMILILHPEARYALSNVLDLQLPIIQPKRQREEAEMIYSHLFQWLFSNPKEWFQQRYDAHKQRIVDRCNHNANHNHNHNSNNHNHHNNNITSSSHHSTAIDVVLQVRTFRDLHTNEPLHDQQFWSQEGSKYHSCSIQLIKQTFLRRLEIQFRGDHSTPSSLTSTPSGSNQQQQQQHLCVYITSDYPSVSRMLKESLLSDSSINHHHNHNNNNNNYNNAKGHGPGPWLGLSQDGQFSYSIVGHDEIYDAQEDWHSGAALKAGHFNPTSDSTSGNRENGGASSASGGSGINSDSTSGGSSTRSSGSSPSSSSHRQWSEVLDWLVMSEAEVAMMTSDSTFGQTARYRAGYFESRHDYRVTEDLSSPINTTNTSISISNSNDNRDSNNRSNHKKKSYVSANPPSDQTITSTLRSNKNSKALLDSCVPVHDMSQLCMLCEQRRRQRRQTPPPPPPPSSSQQRPQKESQQSTQEKRENDNNLSDHNHVDCPRRVHQECRNIAKRSRTGASSKPLSAMRRVFNMG